MVCACSVVGSIPPDLPSRPSDESSAEINNDVDVDIDIECGQDLACHPNDQIKLYRTLINNPSNIHINESIIICCFRVCSF